MDKETEDNMLKFAEAATKSADDVFADREYIATYNPDNVVELIKSKRALEDEIEALYDAIAKYEKAVEKVDSSNWRDVYPHRLASESEHLETAYDDYKKATDCLLQTESAVNVLLDPWHDKQEARRSPKENQ